MVLLPYAFFFHIKKRACICYLTYAEITRHNATVADAKNVARQQKWNLRLFGFVELALSRANSAIGQSTGYGLFHFLVAGAMAILEGAFEVAESYLLPALMIENISLKAAAEKLKSVKSHVPEVLAGTFGLDISRARRAAAAVASLKRWRGTLSRAKRRRSSGRVCESASMKISTVSSLEWISTQIASSPKSTSWRRPLFPRMIA
jgi:hypothetical protein